MEKRTKRENMSSAAEKRARTSSTQMETGSEMGKTTRSHTAAHKSTSRAKNCGK